jgi:hypothetical protein
MHPATRRAYENLARLEQMDLTPRPRAIEIAPVETDFERWRREQAEQRAVTPKGSLAE